VGQNGKKGDLPNCPSEVGQNGKKVFGGTVHNNVDKLQIEAVNCCRYNM
jgi:hypothetical protein